MDIENKDSSEVLAEAIVTKVTQHDKKIQNQEGRLVAVEKKIESSPDLSPAIRVLNGKVNSLAADAKNRELPTDDVQELRGQLKTVIPLLKNPAPAEIEHHHHVPKILWLTAGLFLLVCFLSVGWILTAGKLADFKGNDTKYRKLRLVADSASLVYLNRLDSLYQADPDQLRNNVIEQEHLKQERLELLDKIQSVNEKIDSPIVNRRSNKK